MTTSLFVLIMNISQSYEIWKTSGLGISTVSSKGELKQNCPDPFYQVGVKYGNKKRKKERKKSDTPKNSLFVHVLLFVLIIFLISFHWTNCINWNTPEFRSYISYAAQLAYDSAKNMNRTKMYGFLSFSLSLFFFAFYWKTWNCSKKSA